MALSRHHVAASQPLSVEEIVRQAQEFEFGPNRSLKNWIRSAQLLLTEAGISEQDGDLQKAYLYLYRHAELVIGRFPQHPEYKDPKFKADLVQAQKTVNKNLVKLEQWKPRINQEHQRYVKAMERRNAERQRVHEERQNDEMQRLVSDQLRKGSIGSEDGAYDDPNRALSANENRQLAVDLAHREIRRRDATKQSTHRAGISSATVSERRRGFVADPSEQAVGDGVREAGRHLQRQSHPASRRTDASQHVPGTTSYRYPSVPAKEDTMDWKMPALQPGPTPRASGAPPAIPAKEVLHRQHQSAPPLPPKPREPATSPPAVPPPAPSKYTFKPTASTEAGAPLRTVLLPPDLRTTFLNLAHQNTALNLETCGILCGTVISNALFINHLVIPDQLSTSDTCDTTEEGDNVLFDYCDSKDLLVCGWIHTHPSQSCFLSSRDLHTSSGYQVMLPEAIAIVCAPRHSPDWGIFRLTDPPGLKNVLNCTQSGLFHPHSESNLYTDALRPGHVVEGPGLKFEVVDLRKR